MMSKLTRWFKDKFSISYIDFAEFELKEAKRDRARCMAMLARAKYDLQYYEEIIDNLQKDIKKERL